MPAKQLKKLIQHQAYQIVFLQFVGVVLLSLLAWLFFDIIRAIAVFLGGLAYVLPNLVFVWRVFRYVGASQMMQFVSAFFLAEMGKLIISAIFVLVIVKYLPVSLLSVLVGFIGAIVSFWIACMWHFAKMPVTNSRRKTCEGESLNE